MIIVAATFTGHFHVKILPTGTSLNALGYIEFLKRMIRKFSRMTHDPIEWNQHLLMHDNARPHVAMAVRDFLLEEGTSLLHQPPYSPDVNICDRFLFRNLEHARSGVEFHSDDDLLSFVTNHFKTYSQEMLLQEYQKLKADILFR